MAIDFYPRLSLTGGVSGSLDNLDGDDLEDLDVAMVSQIGVDNKFYVLDDDSGAAESSPDIIAPDTNAGTKRWILLKSYAASFEATTSFTVGDLVITDGVITDATGIQLAGDVDITGALTFDGAGAAPTAFSGADLSIITGTPGDSLDFAAWNADGDLVSGLIALSEIGVLATANEWTKPQNVDETALTSSGNAVAWNAALVQTGLHTLTEDTTVAAPSNLKAGATYILRVVQAAGVYSLAFNAVFDWGAADTPVAPAANGDVVIFSFYSDGTNMYGVDAVRSEA